MRAGNCHVAMNAALGLVLGLGLVVGPGLVFGPGCSGQHSAGPRSGFIGDTHADQGGGATGATASRDVAWRALTQDQARAALARARAEGAHGDAIRLANRVVETGGALGADERRAVLVAIDALPAADLAAVYGELAAEHLPAPLVALRLAFVAEHKGDDARALDWLERSRGAALPDADRVKALQQRIAARQEVEPAVIAVLLPRTGPHARLGAALEAGIRFAARSSAAGARLIFLDTAGDAGQAVAAVDRAVFDHRAVAILGPVGEQAGRRAAARAAWLGVPIALLAPGTDGASPGSGVYRLWSSPRWEAREAVRLALSMGYDRLAVLAPRDELGALATSTFVRAASDLGAQVVATGDYDPTAGDLEPDIKKFLGLDPAQNPRLRRHLRRHGRQGWKSFSPAVPFDLLYIPDEYQRAALVVAYLPYFNVELRSQDIMDIATLKRKHRGRVPRVVQLMGSSGWHHPGVIPRGGAAIEGALVIDVYAGGPDEEFASEESALFARNFHAWAGHSPSPLVAQAYDAALFMFATRARAAAGKATGKALRAAFTRAAQATTMDAGACGPARMDASGQIERAAVLLRIDSGAFVLHEY